MSDDAPSTTSGVETTPDMESAALDEKRPTSSCSEAQTRTTEENTSHDIQQMSEQSQVYNATSESLFSNKNHSKPHIMSLERVYGLNPLLPVFSLQDDDQLVILYACAHVGVIYNENLNSQHILQGHSQPISCLCVSEDRRWIATADRGPESIVMIWDSYSGIPVNTLFDCHPDGGVVAMGFSGDTKLLITLGAEEVQRVCIWDWTNDAQRPLWVTEVKPAYGFHNYIIFNPNDSSQMVSSSVSHVLLYSTNSGNFEYYIMDVKRLTNVRIRRKGTRGFQLSKTVNMADVTLRRTVFHWSEPRVLAASGGNIIVCDVKGGLNAHQCVPKERVLIIPLQKSMITVLAITDRFFYGYCIVTGDSEGQIYIYDDKFGLLSTYNELQRDAIVSISFSKECTAEHLDDGTLEEMPIILRSFVASTLSSTVVHVDALRSSSNILLEEEYEPIHTVACHPHKPLVAIGNQKGILKVWDYNKKVTVDRKSFEKHIQCIAFDPEGRYLVVGFGSGAVHVLNFDTLQSSPEDCFQYTKESIHLIDFSSDSKYFATADTGRTVTVFHQQMNEDSLPSWEYLGRYQSHYKPIKGLLFGVHPGSTQQRLLSLGMDRRLVEYDLENSEVDQLKILNLELIEQSAVPTCMTWYPPLTTEQFLVTASNQYKMKLYCGSTKMCRKTLLGPTYGSPIKQINVLPKSKDLETTPYHLVFITEDKVGLQMLPLDGNPFKSNALLCHPTGVSTFACSADGRLIFTIGTGDFMVFSWEINLNVLAAGASLGGKDQEPFFSLLEGGRNGKFYQEIEEFFAFCRIRHQGIDFMEKRQVSTQIPVSEVSFLMRALAYFPTEREIEDMQNEIKYSKYGETGQYVTDINLGDFIKLYVNHRPAFGISRNEISQAFEVLGHSNSAGLPVLQSYELLELLQRRGEHMTEEEVSKCFATLLGLDEQDEADEYSGPDKIPSKRYSLKDAIPDEISMETFTSHIMSFPSPPDGIPENLKKKGVTPQRTLVTKKNDFQELECSEEDPAESLKRNLKAQRERRKKALLEQSLFEEYHDDTADEEWPSTIQSHQATKKAPKRLDPLLPSVTGLISNTPGSSSSQNLEFLSLRLEEKRRTAVAKAETPEQLEPPHEPVGCFQSFRDKNMRTKFDNEAVTEHPTEEEAYNFFTFNFEPDLDEALKINKKTQKHRKTAEDNEEDRGEEQGDTKKDENSQDKNESLPEQSPLARNGENLFTIDESPQDLLEVRKAEYCGFRKRIQRESELLFTAGFHPAPTSIELPQNTKPCYLEDEGLRVGARPFVSMANEIIVANRLLKTKEGKKWFGDDGRILALNNPIKESFTRPPPHVEIQDPALQTVNIKALKSKYTKLEATDGSDQEGNYQLDIDVSGLIFSHHPLFSREHVLGSHLAQLYDQYLARQHSNLTRHLSDKLNGLRRELHNILEVHSGKKLTAAQQQRISEYSLGVRATRKLRDIEQEKDRTLLKNVIKVWKKVKALRDLQKFTSTPYKLSLRRENVDWETDEREHEDEVLAVVMEVQAEREENYLRKLAKYNEQLEDWKVWRKKQKVKKKVKWKSQAQGDMEEECVMSESEDHTDEGPLKPEPPEVPDVNITEQWVREEVSRIRRKPGEPILIPLLSASGNITTTELCPRAEVARRQDVSRRSLFIKILYNHKEVSQTCSCFLSADFRVHFGQIFNLKILNCPQSINLQVFEGTRSSCSLLAHVFVPVPEPSVLTGSAPLEEFEFSSNQRVMFDHEGVGSDVPISSEADRSNNQTLLTSGKLSCRVSWALGEDGIPLAPPVSNKPPGSRSALGCLDAVTSIEAPGLYDMWAKQSQLDPNDPKFTSNGEVSSPEYFRLEPLQEEFNFVTAEELEKSKRFQLLKLRNQDVAEFHNYRFIPAHEKEVPDNVFQDYEKRLKCRVINDAKGPGRDLLAKNLQKFRESVMNRFFLAKRHSLVSDLVVEDEPPSTGFLGINLHKLVEMNQRLKPQRKERKVTAQKLSDGNFKLLVNVIRAYDIPVRRTMGNEPGHSSQAAVQGGDWDPSQVQVRPFVEVSFQRTVLQTTAADGPNPCWNEELQLPFSAPDGDYSPASLQSVKDKVILNIFDEMVFESGGSDKNKTIKSRVERIWLGSVKIPFHTIYSQLKIDSTFKVNTPAVLLGYSMERNHSPRVVSEILHSFNKGAFITVFITTKPQLVPGEYIKEKFDSQEDERLLQASDRFEKAAAQDYPKRPCITTVMDLSEKTVFITRFIRPLKPPKEFLVGFPNQPQEATTLVARFVSLIPHLPDSVTFLGLRDLWSTCKEFLTFLAGDVKEHAVLLCNYFLFMGKQAWLIIGNAIPEGPTAYVLTLEEGCYLIWNPSTGQYYSQYDTYCPLQVIGCLVDADNVWFNIQEHATPMSMSFDVTEGTFWKPFFSRTFQHSALSSVQPDRLIHQRTDKAAARHLQDRIEKILREKFMEWRPHQPTRWNRYCTAVLNQLLPGLELSGDQAMADMHHRDLEKILGDCKITGFPLNLPFSDVQTITEAVFSTGLHHVQSPGVEFALAVYVYPYPNNVQSVWVYLASLLCV